MPRGVEVTVPLPVPCFCTMMVKTRTSSTSKSTGGPASQAYAGAFHRIFSVEVFRH
jgi:hypothetical protein